VYFVHTVTKKVGVFVRFSCAASQREMWRESEARRRSREQQL
jgi:hypothetical protein